MKRNIMEQWINLHRNNSFVNRMRLPLLWSHTPSASGYYDRLADKILVDLKFSMDHIITIFKEFN